MNKVNTEKYTESFEQWFRDVEAGDDPNWSSPPYLSEEWYQYLSRRELALGAWTKAVEVALSILEQLERGGDWIECSDRLPPDETAVLVNFNGEPRIGELRWDHPTHEESYKSFRYWDCPYNDGQPWEVFDITHWQPLPAPPEGE